MLLVAALLAALNLSLIVAEIRSGGWLASQLDADSEGTVAWLDKASVEWPRDKHEKSRETLAALPDQISIALKTLILLAGLAVGTYMLHPWRVRRRHRPRPLRPEQAPNAVQYLLRCFISLGVPWMRIEYKPGFGEGHAYGLRGREALILHGFPELLERSWGNAHKAIALHEIAHVVNGDAAEREKASAVWYGSLSAMALLMGLLVKYWMWDALRANPGAQVQLGEVLLACVVLGWTFVGQLLVIRFVHRELIRRREFEADGRVASWGFRAALDRLLQVRERHPKRWLGRLWSLHPSYLERREMLANPGSLYRISPKLAFVTGVLVAMIAVSSLVLLSYLALAFRALMFSMAADDARNYNALLLWLKPILSPLSEALCFSVLVYGISCFVTATLGVQVQREAVADLVAGERRRFGYLRLLIPSLLLAVGIEVGLLSAPFSLLPILMTRIALLPLWILGVAFLMWLWLAYIRAATRLSVGGYLGSTFPRGLQSFVIHSSVVLMMILSFPASLSRLMLLARAEMFASSSVFNAQQVLFVSSVFTPTVLAVFACVVYVIWSGAGILVASLALWGRRLRCLRCREPISAGFTIGRRCGACGESLSPWIYSAPDDDPGDTGVNRGSVLQERDAFPEAGELESDRREMRREIAKLSLFLLGFLSFVVVGFIVIAILMRG